MKFQNSIIVSALVSFVFAAHFVEDSDDKAVVPSNSEHLESKSTNFENVEFVPRSVLRKREAEADNKVEEAVNGLYDQLKFVYRESYEQWRELDSKMVEFTKELERVQELAKTARVGTSKDILGYIANLIEGFKEFYKMHEIFEGCDYPGSDNVIEILDLKLNALILGSEQGETKAKVIAQTEWYLREYRDKRERRKDMVPGLQRIFDEQAEKVEEILKDLKTDKRSEKGLNSVTDAAHDEKKSCPEIN